MALFGVHVYGIIVNNNGEVLWVKSKAGLKKFMFPGGTMENGETVKQALTREIKEETNLQVEILQPLFAETIFRKKPQHLGLLYLCINHKGKLKLSKEHDKYKWESPYKIDKKEVAHPELINTAKEAVELLHEEK